MTWEIFLGITALVGFLISIITPFTKLTRTMAELNLNVKHLSDAMDALAVKNTESHRRIWEHNNEQDELIDSHEQRITKIETKMDIMHPESR